MTVLPMNLFAHLILSMATTGWSADSVEVTTVDKASYKAPEDAVLELIPTTREANEKRHASQNAQRKQLRLLQ
jgi:hypothetical protein